LSRGASSGSHSVLVMRPLTPAAEAIYEQARQEFLVSFPALLSDSLRDLPTSLVCALLEQPESPVQQDLSGADWRLLSGFGFAHRGYETTLVPLQKLTLFAIAQGVLEESQAKLMIKKVLQRQGWNRCADSCRLSGRGDGERRLRATVRKLVRLYADDEVKGFALELQAHPGQ
jgi:tRNA(Met) cytidine acetyltransferase